MEKSLRKKPPEPTLEQRALRMLARREYSVEELRRALQRHSQDAQEVGSLIDALCSARRLSDARYAEQLVAAKSRRWGQAKLAYELAARGVNQQVAGAALGEAAATELERARSVWQRKFSARPTNLAERAQQTRFLQNRGFTRETISILLNNKDDPQVT